MPETESPEKFDKLVSEFISMARSSMPASSSVLAVIAVTLDADLAVAHAKTHWQNCEHVPPGASEPSEQFVRENIARLIACHALEDMGEAWTSNDVAAMKVVKFVERRRSRDWTLVADEVHPTIRFLYLVTALSDPDGFDMQMLGWGVGEQATVDKYYTDGCHVAIEHVTTQPESSNRVSG